MRNLPECISELVILFYKLGGFFDLTSKLCHLATKFQQFAFVFLQLFQFPYFGVDLHFRSIEFSGEFSLSGGQRLVFRSQMVDLVLLDQEDKATRQCSRA